MEYWVGAELSDAEVADDPADEAPVEAPVVRDVVRVALK